jgi:3-oxoadipate enol-lactonase
MSDFKGRGFKLHYVEQGKGTPAVFLHGIVMDHTMYAAQFEELPHQYRCLAMDSRGHGRSDVPDGRWSMQDCVDDAVAFIEGMDAGPCHLVGMSWGGMTAVPLALQRADLVRSLTLIDTSADAEDSGAAELYRGFIQQLDADGVSDELIEISKPLLYGERYRADEAAMAVHDDRMGSMNPDAIIEALRAIIGRDSQLALLPTINVPALVIVGEEDVSTPVSEAEKISNGIPGAELVKISGAGHSTPLEAPDAVNEALARFLARAG